MTITVNVGAQVETTSGLTTAVPYPTGVTAGDLLLIVGGTRASGGATTPGGWTQIANFAETSSNAISIFAFYQNARATGSESGTFTVTRSGTVGLMQMFALSGVDTGTVLDVAISTVDNTTAVSTSTCPSITVATTGALLIHLAQLNGTSNNSTPPTGFTETADRATGGADVEAAYKNGVSAGATGTVGNTWSTGGKNIGLLMAIRPASGSSVSWSAPPADSSADVLGGQWQASSTVVGSPGDASADVLAGTWSTTSFVTVTGAAFGLRAALPAGTVTAANSATLTGTAMHVSTAAPGGTVNAATSVTLTGGPFGVAAASVGGTLGTATSTTLTGAGFTVAVAVTAGAVNTGGSVTLTAGPFGVTTRLPAGALTTSWTVSLSGTPLRVATALTGGSVNTGAGAILTSGPFGVTTQTPGGTTQVHTDVVLTGTPCGLTVEFAGGSAGLIGRDLIVHATLAAQNRYHVTLGDRRYHATMEAQP